MRDRDGWPDPDPLDVTGDPRTPADWFAEPDLETGWDRAKRIDRTLPAERSPEDAAYLRGWHDGYVTGFQVPSAGRWYAVPSRRVWVAAVVFGVVAVLVWRAG